MSQVQLQHDAEDKIMYELLREFSIPTSKETFDKCDVEEDAAMYSYTDATVFHVSAETAPASTNAANMVYASTNAADTVIAASIEPGPTLTYSADTGFLASAERVASTNTATPASTAMNPASTDAADTFFSVSSETTSASTVTADMVIPTSIEPASALTDAAVTDFPDSTETASANVSTIASDAVIPASLSAGAADMVSPRTTTTATQTEVEYRTCCSNVDREQLSQVISNQANMMSAISELYKIISVRKERRFNNQEKEKQPPLSPDLPQSAPVHMLAPIPGDYVDRLDTTPTRPSLVTDERDKENETPVNPIIGPSEQLSRPETDINELSTIDESVLQLLNLTFTTIPTEQGTPLVSTTPLPNTSGMINILNARNPVYVSHENVNKLSKEVEVGRYMAKLCDLLFTKDEMATSSLTGGRQSYRKKVFFRRQLSPTRVRAIFYQTAKHFDLNENMLINSTQHREYVNGKCRNARKSKD